MKAWRKYNSGLTAMRKAFEKELKFWAKSPDHSYTQKLEVQRKHAINQRLTRKDARWFFSSQNTPQPSKLLMGMFKHVGLPTPEATI